MSKEKKGTLAVKKKKKPVPAVKEPQPDSIQEFHRLLDTFRSRSIDRIIYTFTMWTLLPFIKIFTDDLRYREKEYQNRSKISSKHFY